MSQPPSHCDLVLSLPQPLPNLSQELWGLWDSEKLVGLTGASY